ncbi:MAG: DUF2971 domain-containing protein, partial [Bacteroidales bacterium]|nr:DUF2971 domain-containing protein [Bacteroidales bacterium]
MENLIHHYTSIDNLSLILNNRKIRFSRLDKVDDLKEIDGLPKAFSTYVFVSCWTYEDEESIPLWKMYTQNMRGVRISLPIDMFEKKLIKAGEYDNYITIEGDVQSLLDIDQLITESYLVVNAHNNQKSFYKKVKYDDNYPEYYKQSIIKDKDKIKINNLYSFGGFKSKIWEFQNESRFTLYIIPLLPLNHPLIRGDKKTQVDNLNFTVINNIENKIEYFDLKLDKN